MSKVTIPALVSQLLSDGTAVVRAEVQLFKARVTTRIAAAKTAAILLVAAAIVAIVSLIGLVMGVVLALSPVVGPAWAGVIVLVVGLVIAGVLAFLGARQFSTKPVATAEMLPALETRS